MPEGYTLAGTISEVIPEKHLGDGITEDFQAWGYDLVAGMEVYTNLDEPDKVYIKRENGYQMLKIIEESPYENATIN